MPSLLALTQQATHPPSPPEHNPVGFLSLGLGMSLLWLVAFILLAVAIVVLAAYLARRPRSG